jgi:rSAM/selenodomain-associated transferase 2
MPARVSIIIPTLNEEKIISATLDALKKLEGEFELIVVDGGSDDRTREIVNQTFEAFPRSRLVLSERGRGIQLNHGARAATGDALLFLHADTMIPENSIALIEDAMKSEEIVGGNFRMVFDGQAISSRLFSRIYNARRWFGLYYGDSAIWARHDVFNQAGRFIDSPLMEDYDFCRKLERAGRTVCFSSPAVTSSRRWTGGRTLLVLMIWILIQWMFLLGAPPDRLAWLYYPKLFRFRKKRDSIKSYS